jgi:hypothetical protein
MLSARAFPPFLPIATLRGLASLTCWPPFTGMIRNTRAKAAREGLAYCLLGSAGRDGSVGRDGDDGAGREGGGWREGVGSRAVIRDAYPNETYCGRSTASCCPDRRIVCRCYTPGPKSRGRTERSAKPRKFAWSFPPFAFRLYPQQDRRLVLKATAVPYPAIQIAADRYAVGQLLRDGESTRPRCGSCRACN